MLELRKINFKYCHSKSNKDICIFNNFGLTIKTNEFVAIVGPSGCGKSTLINLIAGYLKPQVGEIILRGKVLTSPGMDRIVISQQDDLFFWLTVRENLELVIQSKELIEKYLDVLGLVYFGNMYPGELSGGMKKKLILARALASDGDFVLMDEPFSALDNNLKEKLHLELLALKKCSRKTFLLVTHDIEEALFLSDRIIVLNSDTPTSIEKEFLVQYGSERNLEIKQRQNFFEFKNEILRCYR